jgi:hypothetical protein
VADNDIETELQAIKAIIGALEPLQSETRNRVIDYVFKKLGITAPTAVPPVAVPRATAPEGMPLHVTPSSADTTPGRQADIRSFTTEKGPSTVSQMVAIVAYYLAHLAPEQERRNTITGDDINTYFVQAGYPLPTATPSMTLSNAKNAGYLDVADRGQYRLNSVGHNLVVHKLPTGDNGSKRPRVRKRKKPAEKAASRSKK